MEHILGCVFFTQVAAIYIINHNIIDQGFCHLKPAQFELCVDCGYNFNVSVFNSTDGNFILQCRHSANGSWTCGAGNVKGKYNASTDIFEIDFIYNQTLHGGQKYNISVSCNDSSKETQIRLKPCLSGFTGNLTFNNESFITIDCQHSSFNYSSSPIKINLKGGNDYGTCSKNYCTAGCTILRDGLRCVVPYTPGNIYQCYLDGAVYSIDSINNQSVTTDSTRNTTYAIGTAVKSIGVGNTQSMLLAILLVAAVMLSAYCPI